LFAKKNEMHYIETSALDAHNVDEVFSFYNQGIQ